MYLYLFLSLSLFLYLYPLVFFRREQVGSENGSIREDGSIKLFAGRRREKIAPINRKLHPREERGGDVDNFSVEYWKLREKKKEEGETVENAILLGLALSGDKETGLDQEISPGFTRSPLSGDWIVIAKENISFRNLSFQYLLANMYTLSASSPKIF